MRSHNKIRVPNQPEHLYGRKPDLEVINNAYTKAISGEGVLLNILGKSGTGKTSLINYFVKQNYFTGLIFSQGKFSQFGDNRPYTAILQVLEHLADYVLRLSDSDFGDYQKSLVATLGENASVITSLSPRYKAILGEQVQPIVLGASETKNRFNDVIGSILSIFANKAKPLVLHFDDLQWADASSLEMIAKLLMSSWAKNVLFVASYRHDEVAYNNDLQKFIDHFVSEEGGTSIQLDNLSHADIKLYLEDLLYINDIDALVEHVMLITSGNPFYVYQYLTLMFNDRNLWFDDEQDAWLWKTPGDRLEEGSEDVESMLASAIKRFSDRQKKILFYGCCLRDRFTLKDICLLLDETEKTITEDINEINNFNLIAAKDDGFAFIHDRILRAVKDLISGDEYSNITIAIARQLIARLPEQELERRAVEIAGYFNASIHILNAEDAENAFLCNCKAAEQYIFSGVYDEAQEFSLRAKSLLASLSEEKRRAHEFKVLLCVGRCHYLNGDHTQAKIIVKELLLLTDELEDKYKCYSLYKDIVVSEGSHYQQLVSLGVEMLALSFIEVPESMDALQAEIAGVKASINELTRVQKVSEFINADELTDSDSRLLLVLLNDLWEAAYYAGDEPVMHYTTLLNVHFSLRHGNASESAFGYVMYGMMKALDGEYEQAYEFGKLALNLNAKMNDQIELPKVTNLFCNYIAFYTKSFSHSAELYCQSAEVGRKNGDHLFGLWAAMFEVWSRYLAGENLDEIIIRADELEDFIVSTNDTKIIYVYRLLQDVLAALVTPGNNPDALGEYGDYIEYWQQNDFLPGVSWLCILLGQYYCIVGDYRKANALLNREGLNASFGIIMFPYAQYVFYSTLASIKCDIEDGCDISDSSVPIGDHIELLSDWKKTSPENFEYQYYLLKAESAALANDNWGALQFYNQAISSAEVYSNNYSLAFANAMKAQFMGQHKDHGAAVFHQKVALNYYALWGVRCLLHDVKLHEHRSETSQGELSSSRDFDVVVSFTKELSHEFNEEALLSKTLEHIVKISDADKGVLLTQQGGKLFVRNALDRKSGFKEQLLNIELDKTSVVPVSLIRYVARSKNALIVDNADFDEQYSDFRYFSDTNVEALLCVPIVHQQHIEAILYLESSSSSRIFSDELINILSIIMSQMIVSLVNGSLYRSLLEESNKLKDTAEELHISKERLSMSMRYSEVGVWEWNIETNDLYWNEMIGPIFGGPESEMDTSYENFISAVHPEDRDKVEDAIQACFDGDEYRVRHRIIWDDGTVRWVDEAGDVTRNDEGKPIKMFGTARDVTEVVESESSRFQLEHQLQQAQKMEAIGHLTGGIAHDFNNLLSVMSGFTELLARETKQFNDDKINNYVRHISVSADRAAKLVKQMLTFSRTHKPVAEPIDIKPIVKETVKMLSSMLPSTISIQSEIGANLPNIVADPVQLNQIIINLCINARDAIGEKGNIVISTSLLEDTKISCSSCYNEYSGGYLELSIADDGSGISEDILRNIFTPFFTTKKVGEGTGMGLSMVHGLVHGFDGHIQVETEPGKGSVFKLLLKTTAEAVEHEDVDEEFVTQDLGQRHILVVDDEPEVTDFYKEVLSGMLNYQVSVYTDSKVAFNEIKEGLGKFDLLITDYTMPDYTGVDLFKTATEIDPDFPVIICTGYSEHLTSDKADEIGVKELLYKPVHINQLIESVNNLLIK